MQAPPIQDPEALRTGAEDVVRRLHKAGFTAYWAGGCVRDEIMGRQPVDYDVATDAVPDQVEALFPGSHTVGKIFGVVRVPALGHYHEVATFRSDHGASDGRRPDRIAFTDPPTDARRRDFTINALFYDVESKTVTDFVGGQEDIRKGLIRCVGDPHERFREDYLRMLRAVRFASVLEFRIEEQTAAAIRDLAPLAASIAAERVRDELSRLLTEAPMAGNGLLLLDKVGLLDVLLPELAPMKGQAQPPQFHPEGDVFQHTVLMLNEMREASPQLAFASLLHDVGKPATARLDGDRIRFDRHANAGADIAHTILKRLRFSKADTDAIVQCIAGHMRFMDVQRMKQSTLRKFVGEPHFPLELEMHRLDCTASHGKLDNHAFLVQFLSERVEEPVLPAPWVTGHDILQLGLPEGPPVGVWRAKAYDAQLEGRFSDREKLLEWMKAQIRGEADAG